MLSPMRLSKQDIAMGHLEVACVLYLAGRHPATVVLLAGTAEDMLRALPPASDTPTIGEHMLQVAKQMTSRHDLVYRDIEEHGWAAECSEARDPGGRTPRGSVPG